MVNHFIDHIRSKNILDIQKPYLLAISGGMDSVCLGHLLKKAGFDFSLAHVNFQLRDAESDGDEAFVRDLADLWEVAVFVNKTHFDQFKGDQQSLQMSARDFRYNWFEDLISQNKFEGVLVAHHFEDQVETVMLNLMRGTGIEGVYGMAERRGNIIRPLLSFRRRELLDFMEKNSFSWRNDSSNNKSDYKRNYIRNEVIPVLAYAFPDPGLSLQYSFQRIKDTGNAFFHFFHQWKKEKVQQEGDYQYLKFEDITAIPGKKSILYYWLRDFGFNYDDVLSVISAIQKGESGKTFSSRNNVLIIDRDILIVGKQNFDFPKVELSATDIGLKLQDAEYEILKLSNEVKIDRSPINAMMDMDKLIYPLSVRKWEHGDKFVPLGMKNEKKISDLLINLKVPLIHKKTVAVLCSGNEIAWVIGYRINDRFKCDANTKNVLYFKRKSDDQSIFQNF